MAKQKTTSKTRGEQSVVKQMAFTMYTEKNLDQKMIATMLKTSENTISRWKIEGDWDAARDAYQTGSDSERRIMQQLLREDIAKCQAEGSILKYGDSIKKITAAIRDLKTEEIELHIKSKVGMEFVSHVQKTAGQANAQMVLEFWSDYLMSSAQ